MVMFICPGTVQLALADDRGTAAQMVTWPVGVTTANVTVPVGFVPLMTAVKVNGERYVAGLLELVRVTEPGGVIAKLVVTGVAAAKFALPACTPCNVHVPRASKVIVAPLTPEDVQIAVVVYVTVTGKPDEAVGVTIIGPLPSGRLPGELNAIVCAPWIMVMLCCT